MLQPFWRKSMASRKRKDVPAWLIPHQAEARTVATSTGDEAAALIALLETFRARFPELWQELRLCPLQHGLETIVEHLRLPVRA